MPPELASYVDSARGAIRDEGSVAIDMRGFPPASRSTADTCRAEVQRCDVFVLILGKRYGKFIPDGPRMSYTELEFWEAIRCRMPILAFFLDEINDGSDNQHDIDREARAARDRFHDAVREDGRTAASVGSSHDVYGKLRTALQDLAREHRVDHERRSHQADTRRLVDGYPGTGRDQRVRWAALATLTTLAAVAAIAVVWAASASSATQTATAASPIATPTFGETRTDAPSPAPLGPATATASTTPDKPTPGRGTVEAVAAQLDARAEQDLAEAESLTGRLVPQLSVLAKGIPTEDKAAKQDAAYMQEQLDLLTGTPWNAIVIDTADFEGYPRPPGSESQWALLVPEPFDTEQQVRTWCTDNDRDFGTTCLAKRLERL